MRTALIAFGDFDATFAREFFAKSGIILSTVQLFSPSDDIGFKHGFEYFTTTLSISPLKDAQVLNRIGLKLGEEYGVKYLTSDFKKNGGYQRSIELSKEYNLYRQNYCGCMFSKAT